MAFGRTTSTLSLLTYWHRLALFNSNTLNVLMKSCMGQRSCNAVVWIAELACEESWKLVEINLTTVPYFSLVELFKNSFT